MGLGCPECGSLRTGVHLHDCSVGERERLGEHRSYLCVGGPAAGRRVESMTGSGFAVPVMTNRTFVNSYGETQSEFERHEYRRETFHTTQGDVSMWVPGGQTHLETMTLLLETYERAKIAERESDLKDIVMLTLDGQSVTLKVSSDVAEKICGLGFSRGRVVPREGR